MRRALGFLVVTAIFAIASVAPMTAPAGAAGAGGGTIFGQVSTADQPVQWFAPVSTLLWGPAVFAAAPTAGACATTVAFNNLIINYSLQSPAAGPIRAGLLYSVGSFAPGGTFAGGLGSLCGVNGTIGNGALFGATGDSLVSVGAVVLTEFEVSFTVSTLSLAADSGPEEAVAVFSAVPGVCPALPLNLNCSLVSGAVALG